MPGRAKKAAVGDRLAIEGQLLAVSAGAHLHQVQAAAHRRSGWRSAARPLGEKPKGRACGAQFRVRIKDLSVICPRKPPGYCRRSGCRVRRAAPRRRAQPTTGRSESRENKCGSLGTMFSHARIIEAMADFEHLVKSFDISDQLDDIASADPPAYLRRCFAEGCSAPALSWRRVPAAGGMRDGARCHRR